ncbi:MAG: KEOPS complex subunit Cgi121 [Candidatus Thermoplasmatota archaeon]|nr:KEOPS complex subunit Cgi121 [Candidatus Thermoplasmatota archaeon]MEC8680919.1 KEOPS complex subunit Cgi121 [Candidatus Thermoplasmatota archaeon]
MSPSPFPLANVQLNGEGPKEAIDRFLNHRPSERWVLLGGHAAQGMDQLWAAWIQATRNELRGAMVARSIDAEFLRYLAGTHHISEAFARAGLQPGQQDAWVVYLPEAKGVANDLGHVQPVAILPASFQDDVNTLCSLLVWLPQDVEASYSIEGASMLGVDVEGWPKDREEEALVAHILMADDQSSSHR